MKSLNGTYRKKSVILIQGVVDESLLDRLKQRKSKDIFVLEGRPTLEAAKTLSKQLLKRKLTPTLIADNMAGVLFYKELVKEIWVSYQLSDEEGALCDIGALIVSILGKRHKIPVYLYPAGRTAKLMGKPNDVFSFNGVRTAPRRIKAYAPLTEWVPMNYVTKVYA